MNRSFGFPPFSTDSRPCLALGHCSALVFCALLIPFTNLMLISDLHDFDDFNDNDNGALAEPSSASEEWNPDAMAIPMLCFSTKEILFAADQLSTGNLVFNWSMFKMIK